MVKPRRILVTRNIPKHVPDVINYGRNVLQSMRSNPTLFGSASPSLDKMDQHLDELEAAETAAKSRTKGTIEKRNVCLAKVHADLDYSKSNVQQVADANPDQAEAIIQSSGMSVRKPGIRVKSDFTVRQAEVSGSVKISVRATRGKAAYEWQMSTDQKSWTALPVTVHATTAVQNLTPATTYFFRYRVVTAAGEGEWSQIVSLLVT